MSPVDPASPARIKRANALARRDRLESLALDLYLVSIRAGRVISPDQAAVTAGDILDAVDLTHARREENRKL